MSGLSTMPVALLKTVFWQPGFLLGLGQVISHQCRCLGLAAQCEVLKQSRPVALACVLQQECTVVVIDAFLQQFVNDDVHLSKESRGSRRQLSHHPS